MTFSPTGETPPSPIVNPLYMRPPGGQARRLDNLVLGQPFTYLPGVDGGSGGRTFAITPAPTNGLSHRTDTGEISGTPTSVADQGPFTQTVTDAASGTSSSTKFWLGAKPPTMATDQLPILTGNLTGFDGLELTGYDGQLLTGALLGS